MHITKAEIVDYRNYKRQSITLCPFVNFLTGANAQGKTNLLEALYLSAVARSPRTPRDRELIRWEESRAKVSVTAQKSYGADTVEIVIDKAAQRKVSINGLPVTRIGELMGVVKVVFFSPDEMRIIKESPSDRRRFLDIALSQISKAYFYLCQRYNRIVSQRNRLIKSGQAAGAAGADNLDIWDNQLADSGSLIIKTRRGFVSALCAAAREQHLFLTDGKEELSLEYESVEGESAEEIKAAFLTDLKAGRDRDLRLGYTGTGPHKDDLGVYIDKTDARKFASQGQQRTAALSIKLAEVDLAADKGETPVLLLDDVFGELDLSRRQKLIQRIKGMQAVITCTDLDEDIIKDLGEHKVFFVKNGEVNGL